MVELFGTILEARRCIEDGKGGGMGGGEFGDVDTFHTANQLYPLLVKLYAGTGNLRIPSPQAFELLYEQ